MPISHPCTELLHNHSEFAECNEKMTSSEPSATLLHICSVWNEQKPHEVLTVFQVEAAILRVKDVNVWDGLFSLTARRATHETLIVRVSPVNHWDAKLFNTTPMHGFSSQQQLSAASSVNITVPAPSLSPDWLLCFLFSSSLLVLKMMNQLDKCKYLNIHLGWDLQLTSAGYHNYYKCSLP